MRKLTALLCLVAAFVIAGSAHATVLVSQPFIGQTTGTNVTFDATATTATCSRGIASIGVYIDNTLVYVAQGASLNTTLPVSLGSHYTVVQAWDNCGGSTNLPVPITAKSQAGVWVNSPAGGNSSTQPAFVASATTTCASGIAAMGLYIDNQLVEVENGNALNYQAALTPGAHNTIVQSWDNCGGYAKTPIDLTVLGASNTFSNLQLSSAWKMSGQKAPYYDNCVDHVEANACAGITYSYNRNIANPSMSGSATQFNLGGTLPYSDVLFWNHLIGAFSSQNLPDVDHTLIAATKNFTYDAYFYVSSYDEAHTQALEFDINWFLNSFGMTWGTECRMHGGHEWALWNNVDMHWEATGIACNPLKDAWNHVTINGKRNDDNTLTYQTITLNGKTIALNKTVPPFYVPANWYGVTVNYQMDGDEHQTAIKSYVDKLSLIYW